MKTKWSRCHLMARDEDEGEPRKALVPQAAEDMRLWNTTKTSKSAGGKGVDV